MVCHSNGQGEICSTLYLVPDLFNCYLVLYATILADYVPFFHAIFLSRNYGSSTWYETTHGPTNWASSYSWDANRLAPSRNETPSTRDKRWVSINFISGTSQAPEYISLFFYDLMEFCFFFSRSTSPRNASTKTIGYCWSFLVTFCPAVQLVKCVKCLWAFVPSVPLILANKCIEQLNCEVLLYIFCLLMFFRGES